MARSTSLRVNWSTDQETTDLRKRTRYYSTCATDRHCIWQSASSVSAHRVKESVSQARATLASPRRKPKIRIYLSYSHPRGGSERSAGHHLPHSLLTQSAQLRQPSTQSIKKAPHPPSLRALGVGEMYQGVRCRAYRHSKRDSRSCFRVDERSGAVQSQDRAKRGVY